MAGDEGGAAATRIRAFSARCSFICRVPAAPAQSYFHLWGTCSHLHSSCFFLAAAHVPARSPEQTGGTLAGNLVHTRGHSPTHASMPECSLELTSVLLREESAHPAPSSRSTSKKVLGCTLHLSICSMWVTLGDLPKSHECQFPHLMRKSNDAHSAH